jgi:DNA-binding MarR family transcriptional regulator
MPSDMPCACSTLRRATRAVTAAYDSALAPVGLRITQFAVLRSLARLGPLPVSRLAAEIALDRSTMGRNLDPLERRGLVRFAVGEYDQRERVAHLTPAGEAAIASALPYWRDAQRRIDGLVENASIVQLAEKLKSLSAA